MKNINTIQDDPKLEPFCELAKYFMKEYGVRVWHSNVMNTPKGKNPEDVDVIRDFYKPLEDYGYNLDNEVYCFGGSEIYDQ